LFHPHGLSVVKNNDGGGYVPVEEKLAQIDLEIEDKDNEIAISNNKALKQGLWSLSRVMKNKRRICYIMQRS
jgi:hypothetical protein